MKEPILITDGARGIYAESHAARTILSMLKSGLWELSGGDRDDLVTAADPDNDQAFEAWGDFARNGELRHLGGYGTFTIWQDGDIFLVPDGYELEQA